MLRVDGTTVGVWIREGKIKFVVLPGGSRRIPLGPLFGSLGGNYDLAGEFERHNAQGVRAFRPDLLTVAEAASLLQVTVKTIHAWISDDNIKFVILPGGSRSRRIPRGALLASLGGNFDLAGEIEERREQATGASRSVLLTVSQAASLLRVDPGKTMRAWMSDDRVKYVILPGGSRRIPMGPLLDSLGGNYDLAGDLAAPADGE